MGKGGAGAVEAPKADQEKMKLVKENSALRVRVSELDALVLKVDVRLMIQ